MTPPLPTFLVIGAQRAGTTWLHACLQEHPDVFVPQTKELDYFSAHYPKGLDWYRGHFAGWTGQRAVGEVTPEYCFVPGAVERMFDVLPEAKLVFVLRDPVSRAFSQYQLLLPTLPVRTTFRQVYESRPGLIQRGQYARMLKTLYAHYPKEQVLPILYDQLESDPRDFLRQVFGFIGVDPEFAPRALAKQYNSILFPRTQRLLGNVGLTWAVDWLKRTPVSDWVKRAHRRVGPKIRPDDAKHVGEQFVDDVRELSRVLDKDLSHWLTRYGVQV